MAEKCGKCGIAENIAAVRVVSPGHLHELPDGTVGIYTGTQVAQIGDRITLHQEERVKVACDPIALAAAGALVKFDFTTQTVKVAGTNIGYYHLAKPLNATVAIVNLNWCVKAAT
jgi:hypothetical protein